MKNPYGHEYSISLTIRGEQVDPAAVTTLLGTKPTRAWVKGEQLRPRCPAKSSGWVFTLHPREAEREWTNLSDGLMQALEQFEAHRTDIQCLAKQCEVCWVVGHFQSTSSGGWMFSPELLRKLAEFGIDIGFDNYFHHDHSGNEAIKEHS